MSKTLNILLTYPSDNIKKSWSDILYQKLKMAFARTLPVKAVWDIRSDITDIHKSKLENYQAFIIVLDHRDNTNKEFQKYLEDLGEYLEAYNTKNKNPKQIIKILRSPNNDCAQPHTFKPVSGYNFYEFSGNKNSSVSLDFENTDQNVKAWKLILDLAFNLKDDLEKDKVKESALKKSVYLSPCSTDLISVRDEFKRELINRNFNVLPESNNIPNVEKFEEVTLENISNSLLVIQLLGAKYGNSIKGKSGSYLEFENTLINNSSESGIEFSRIIWIPNSIKHFEPKQELFINRIKKNLTGKNSFVYHTSKDEFKELLLNTLDSELSETNKTSASGELVYLISPNSEEKNILKEKLITNHLNVVSLNETNSQTAYKEHLQYLTNSDHVLIYWKNHDSYWLNSKMSDLIKAPGLGREKPFKSITIFTNGIKPDISGFTPWLPEVSCISEDKPTDLVEYLARIKDKKSDER